MQTRYYTLQQWLKETLKTDQFTATPLAGDASFRRYYRVRCEDKLFIVMDAPPDKETVSPFIKVGQALEKIGIHTPKIHAYELAQGFVLLEDLGDQLLLSLLTADNVDSFYGLAMVTLVQIQQCSIDNPGLPAFDKDFMLQELSLFRHWFLDLYLQLKLDTTEERLLDDTFDGLSSQITQQPQVFVHRDFHSRNLMVLDKDGHFDLGIIDFQDAMNGPFTYDLVSLLKDCYIQWPREKVLSWVNDFYTLLPNHFNWDLPAFIKGFELCGLQRHLKVLGIFCRLHFRDKKSSYLNELPLIFNYVMSCLESLDGFQPFYQFMHTRVQLPLFEKHS